MRKLDVDQVTIGELSPEKQLAIKQICLLYAFDFSDYVTEPEIREVRFPNGRKLTALLLPEPFGAAQLAYWKQKLISVPVVDHLCGLRVIPTPPSCRRSLGEIDGMSAICLNG